MTLFRASLIALVLMTVSAWAATEKPLLVMDAAGSAKNQRAAAINPDIATRENATRVLPRLFFGPPVNRGTKALGNV